MSNKTITMEFYRNANFLDILFKLEYLTQVFYEYRHRI